MKIFRSNFWFVVVVALQFHTYIRRISKKVFYITVINKHIYTFIRYIFTFLSAQSKNALSAKIVEIKPKLNFLGANIDETVALQRENDDIYQKIQTQQSPIDEFLVKSERLLAEKKANPKLLEAMGQSLHIIWQDLLHIIEQRRQILNVNANFHEKFANCLGKMAALEVSCSDTMLPNGVDEIQEFLNSFKQIRIDMLVCVMEALKEGNELCSLLRETAMCTQWATRPDIIKVDIKKALAQVERWLEELHDRRNELEQAWQKRKMQLEQCLAYTMLMRDIDDLQKQLNDHRSAFNERNHYVDTETNVATTLNEITALKEDAKTIRDRALKITRSTEKLSNIKRDDSGNNKAYTCLHQCSEFIEEIDNYEDLLVRLRDFFEKAERTLASLRRLEAETSTLFQDGAMESCTLAQLINNVVVLIEEPLRLGYAILDRIGRSNAMAQGVERTVAEIENRRLYLEEFYTQNCVVFTQISQTMDEFYDNCEQISMWLASMRAKFLISNNSMGKSLEDGKYFLQLHHQLLSDLEAKGSDINELLMNTSKVLESLDTTERLEVDQRIEDLRNTWKTLEIIVENRVDLSTNFVKMLQLSGKLSEMFTYFEQILQSQCDATKLPQMNELWTKIEMGCTQLRNDGNSFVEHTSMVSHQTIIHLSLSSFAFSSPLLSPIRLFFFFLFFSVISFEKLSLIYC